LIHSFRCKSICLNS